MKNPVTQLIVLAALMAAAGTIYNFANSRNPEKFLTWVDSSGRYRDWNKVDAPPPTADGVKLPIEKAPGPEPQKNPTPAPGAAVDTKPAPGAPSQPEMPSEFTMIPIEDAYKELLDGTPFIDARRTREYEAGHIATAISMSAWEGDLAEKIAKLSHEGTPAEAPVVVYCGDSKECGDSKMVCGQLKAFGFVNLMIYQGGFPEWSKQKPELVTKGKEPGTFTPPQK